MRKGKGWEKWECKRGNGRNQRMGEGSEIKNEGRHMRVAKEIRKMRKPK